MKKNITNKKIGKLKFAIWFLIVALIIDIMGFASLSQINQIAEPLSKDIPRGIEEITADSHLNGLAQFIRYYDEVLTMSARNYAFTSDTKWKERYNIIAPQLDKIIKEAIEKGDEHDIKFFSSVDGANLALVEMEERSIRLVDNKKVNEAIEILESNEYWIQKDIYKKGLVDYVSHKGFTYDETLKTSTDTIKSASEQTESLIKFNQRIILGLIIFGIVIAVILGISIIVNLYRRKK